MSSVKPEFTGKRELNYNKWHRTIGHDYFMIDLDSVEWRKDRGVVAIIERGLFTGKATIDNIIEFKRFEIKVVSEIAEKLKVPAYLVFYTIDNDEMPYDFMVYQIFPRDNFLGKMTQEQYTNFIKKL